MRFINPKTDFAFKKIFGSGQSRGILVSFLNALLYQERPVIRELEILDPYLAPKIQGVKDTFVDVRARLEDGRTVIIEMQVLNVEGFEKRVLYNAAKAYSTQLPAGQDYRGLNGVIALTITDFVMFSEWAEVQSAFVLKEKGKLTDYPEGDLELVFVELPKFEKRLEELATVKEKWLFFLRNARDLQMIPETMGAVPEIQEAFGMANLAGLSAEELDDLERREMFIHDQRNALIKAEKTGLAHGMATGLAQGVAKGLAQGREQGLIEAQREIARRLLGQMSDERIAEATGLTPQQVKALTSP